MRAPRAHACLNLPYAVHLRSKILQALLSAPAYGVYVGKSMFSKYLAFYSNVFRDKVRPTCLTLAHISSRALAAPLARDAAEPVPSSTRVCSSGNLLQHVAGSGTLLQTHPHQCAQLVSLVMNVYPFDVKPLFKVRLLVA